jgi:hypothetical protein
LPTACAASVWNSTPRARQSAPISASGLILDRALEAIEIDQPARLDRQVSRAKAFLLHRRGAFEHAFMLGHQGHDMVLAELLVEAQRAFDREVVRFGRARGEDDLPWIGMDERRKLTARALDRRFGLAAISMGDRRRIAEFLGEPGQHRLQHARIAGRRRLVIEIDRRLIALACDRGGHAALARVRA